MSNYLLRQKKITGKKLRKIEKWELLEIEKSNEWGITTHPEILRWNIHDDIQQEPKTNLVSMELHILINNQKKKKKNQPGQKICYVKKIR